jgi:hypothetical protein
MSSHVEQPPMDPKQVNRNRMKLLGVFGVALIPVIAAAVMYFGGIALPTGKTNKGNLLWPPIVLSEQNAISPAVNDVIVQDGLWVLMLTGKGDCTDTCLERLHTLRQVNVAMGKELDRVGRVYVGEMSAETKMNLASTYPKLKIFESSASNLITFKNQAINSSGVAPQSIESSWNIWLVDPLGNVILQYGLDNDGYDMKGDLKKLLKLSNIG